MRSWLARLAAGLKPCGDGRGGSIVQAIAPGASPRGELAGRGSMKRLLTLVLIALVAYAAGYAYVRTAWAQKRALDGVTYVVYPTDRMWS